MFIAKSAAETAEERAESTRREWLDVVVRQAEGLDGPTGTTRWAEGLETASAEQLRDLRSAKLRALVRYLHANSGYYQRQFAELGLEPGDISDEADLARVPVLTRDELAADQGACPPWGSVSPMSDQVWRHRGWQLFATSGTTMRPRAFRFSDHDRTLFAWLYARALYAGGVRSGELALNCFSYGPFVGFWGVHLALNRLGCPVIPGGGMDTSRRVLMIAYYRPTVLVGTPSYLLRLADAVEQQGHDPARGSVRYLVTAGEPGTGIPAMKARMEQRWGARIVDLYGCTEVAPAPLAYLCEAEQAQTDRGANAHLNEDAYLAEVVDPATWTPVAEGERGVLVCTNLWSEGNPFLRYAVGDYLTVTSEPCACGRTSRRVVGGFTGRPDDMVKVRGVPLFPSTIEAIVLDVPELGGEFEMVLTTGSDSTTELTVRAEARPDVPGAEHARLRDALAQRIRAHVGIRVPVELLPYGELPRSELKAKRIKDLRTERGDT